MAAERRLLTTVPCPTVPCPTVPCPTVPCPTVLYSLMFGLLVLACEGKATDPQEPVDCTASPGEVFEQRIAPLLAEEHPNTCAQCHAGGVDLAAFLRPDPCESMACMKQQGLVNLDVPEASVILTFIDRAEPDSDLITEQVLAEERLGFLSWIRHEAACGECSAVSCPEPPPPECNLREDPGILTPETDSLGCEEETLERLFRGTVYNWRGRCSPCHFQEEETATDEAPRWATRTGTCQVASLNTFRNIERGGYINIEDPTQSLLVLKPLSESEGGIPHGGHAKVQTKDLAYEDFIYFLERYADCKRQ